MRISNNIMPVFQPVNPLKIKNLSKHDELNTSFKGKKQEAVYSINYKRQLKRYDNIQQAAQQTGADEVCIKFVLAKKIKSCKGLAFVYEKEILKKGKIDVPKAAQIARNINHRIVLGDDDSIEQNPPLDSFKAQERLEEILGIDPKIIHSLLVRNETIIQNTKIRASSYKYEDAYGTTYIRTDKLQEALKKAKNNPPIYIENGKAVVCLSNYIPLSPEGKPLVGKCDFAEKLKEVFGENIIIK